MLGCFFWVLASLRSCICAVWNLSLFLFRSLFWAIPNVILLYFRGKMGRTEREGILITETLKLHCSWWTRLQSYIEGMHEPYSWNNRSCCSDTGYSASQKLRFVNLVARDMWLWANIPAETLLRSTWRTGRKSRKNPNHEEKKELIGNKTKNRNILGRTLLWKKLEDIRKDISSSCLILSMFRFW